MVGDRAEAAAPASTGRKKAKQRVRVYSPVLLQELLSGTKTSSLEAEPPAEASTSEKASEAGDEAWPSKSALQRRIDANRQAHKREYDRVGDLTKKQQQLKVANMTRRREAAFQAMWEELQRGLDSQQGIVGEVNTLLQSVEEEKRTQSAALFKEWEAAVYNKIRERIAAGMSRRPLEQIQHWQRCQYEDFLYETNTKRGIFRDTIIPTDYDPLAWRASSLKYPASDIVDPVKHELEEPLREQRMIGKVLQQAPLGKETLRVTLWDKIDSTPCGHHMDTRGCYLLKPMSEKEVAARRSRLVFDHYNFPRGNDIDELRVTSGKQMGGAREVRGGRRLFEVLQGRSPTATAQEARRELGDAFLEAWFHEGKRRGEGPEVRRGRADLSETLLQLSNPYQDGRSLGDQWLEAKGRRIVPGPEQHRGRQGLFETIQQAKLQPGDKAVGDLWLEARGRPHIEPSSLAGHEDMSLVIQRRPPDAAHPASAFPGARGRKPATGLPEPEMAAVLRGGNAPVRDRPVKTAFTASHLQMCETLQPTIDFLPPPRLKLHGASHLEASEGFLHSKV